MRSASHWGRVTLEGVTCPTLANQKLPYGCIFCPYFPNFELQRILKRLWQIVAITGKFSDFPFWDKKGK